jgi:hypothetical protein
MRVLAAEGHSRKTASGELGMTLSALDYHANNHKIAFQRMTKSARAEELGPTIAARYTAKMREVYKQELAREIAAAKREMPTAPPYRPAVNGSGEPV